MIEEIKNEIIDLTPLFGNKEGVCILRKEVFKILDKYNNEPDYKSAWNELKNLEIGEDEKGNKYYFKSDGTMEELEQKYNLGGE